MALDCSLGSLPPARHPKKLRTPTGLLRRGLLAVNVRQLTKLSQPLKNTVCRLKNGKREVTGRGEI